MFEKSLPVLGMVNLQTRHTSKIEEAAIAEAGPISIDHVKAKYGHRRTLGRNRLALVQLAVRTSRKAWPSLANW
ncbi:hypothetical protein [Bradyrhizobium sp. 76]|uniref:hypothetical protein n=1 Tax=Bradyrhizobium sp. 76 TaxID=2782680 RepID=UPI001FFBDD27|nr:hypothetical protein [Bradyrhizobium sp. 76]